MNNNTLGKQLVIKALGDSYYPDLVQVINAERMVYVIDKNPLIAAIPMMLGALKMAEDHLVTLASKHPELIQNGRTLREIQNAIAKAEEK